MVPLIMLCPEEYLQCQVSSVSDENIEVIEKIWDDRDSEEGFSYILRNFLLKSAPKDILFSQGEYLNLRNQLLNRNSEFLSQLKILFYKVEDIKHCKIADIQIIFQVLFEQLWKDAIKEYPFFSLYFQEKDLQLLIRSDISGMEELLSLISDLGAELLELTRHFYVSVNSELIAQVCEYLWTNVDKEIHLCDIARQFYVNKSYLSHLFRQETGRTFMEYYTEVRMLRSRVLLEQQHKVYECALLLGYRDTEYFSKVFKCYFGCKPTEYKGRKYCRK